MVGQMSRPKHIERREVMMALFACLVARPLSAQEIKKHAPARSIGIASFFGVSPDELEKGRDLALLIASDLRDSGKFTPVDPDKYSGAVINPDSAPEFGSWRALNVESLVTGRLSLQPDGRFKVEFHLWDVGTARQISAAQYFVTADRLQQVSHVIAASIYERLIGHAPRFEDKN